MEASVSRAQVRPIRSARLLPLGPEAELHTITAQLTLSAPALARLLSVSGTENRFIISSADGKTSVQARLMVATVPEGEQAFGNGKLVLNWSRGTLAHGDRTTTLSRMELRLLAALIDAAPGPISKTDLVARLWSESSGRPGEREKSLKVWICQLRRHFVAVGQPEAIDTVRGVGYRLCF
jgi:DNA-binding winged helix-turn-helix (wHTH) protein